MARGNRNSTQPDGLKAKGKVGNLRHPRQSRFGRAAITIQMADDIRGRQKATLQHQVLASVLRSVGGYVRPKDSGSTGES